MFLKAQKRPRWHHFRAGKLQQECVSRITKITFCDVYEIQSKWWYRPKKRINSLSLSERFTSCYLMKTEVNLSEINFPLQESNGMVCGEWMRLVYFFLPVRISEVSSCGTVFMPIKGVFSSGSEWKETLQLHTLNSEIIGAGPAPERSRLGFWHIPRRAIVQRKILMQSI